MSCLVPRPPFKLVRTVMRTAYSVEFAGEQEAQMFWTSLLITPRSSPYDRVPPNPIATAEREGATVHVPRALGQAVFGPPDEIRCTHGDDADFGSLTCAPLPHQQQPIQTLVDNFGTEWQQVLRAGCGDGKTYSALAVVHAMRGKTLVLVHTDLLVKQWEAAASKFLTGVRVGVTKAKRTAAPDANLVIASIQTLISRNVGPEFFAPFRLTVIDEAHHVPAQSFSKIVGRVPGRRLALSATPDGRSDGLARLLYWVAGNQVEMDGPRVVACVEKHVYTPRTRQAGFPIATRTRRRLSQETARNVMIARLVRQKVDQGHAVLIFCEFIEHVDVLAAMVPRSGVYTGKKKENVDNTHALFATYSSFKEGVDFGHISCLVMAMPIAGNTEQVLGRIRKAPPGSHRLDPVVVDIRDIPLWNNFKYAKLDSFYSQRGWTVTS